VGVSETKSMWDWSPRHVRMRYEMLLVSTIIFMIGKYEVESFKLSPVKLAKNEGSIENFAFWILAIYFVFLLVSIVIRSRYEENHASSVHFELSDKIEKFKTGFSLSSNSLKSISEAELKNVFEKTKVIHDELTSLRSNIRLQIDNTQSTKVFFEKIEKLDLEQKRKEYESLSKVDRLNNIDKAAPSKKYTDFQDHISALDSMHDRYWKVTLELQKTFKEINKSAETLQGESIKHWIADIKKLEEELTFIRKKYTRVDYIQRQMFGKSIPATIASCIFMAGCTFQFGCWS
jgi:hypothetical protein